MSIGPPPPQSPPLSPRPVHPPSLLISLWTPHSFESPFLFCMNSECVWPSVVPSFSLPMTSMFFSSRIQGAYTAAVKITTTKDSLATAHTYKDRQIKKPYQHFSTRRKQEPKRRWKTMTATQASSMKSHVQHFTIQVKKYKYMRVPTRKVFYNNINMNDGCKC